MSFIHSLQSEWLKTRRSAASWLCIAGGAFLPLLFLIGSLARHFYLQGVGSPNAWITYNMRLWQFMGVFLLPMGIVLSASLMTQIEYRNNAWKQLHATPQRYITIFCAKLAVIIIMTLKFFLFFNIGVWLSAAIPAFLFSGRLPSDPLPVADLLKLNAQFFLCCLPVITLQYLLSLMFRNFLAPVGIGLLLIIGSTVLIQVSKRAWLSPFSYSQYLAFDRVQRLEGINIFWLAAGYTVLFGIAAYALYRGKRSMG